jgi:hypothetical protein
MALCRYVLALPPLVDMERQEIIDQIGPTLQRYLTGLPLAAVTAWRFRDEIHPSAAPNRPRPDPIAR